MCKNIFVMILKLLSITFILSISSAVFCFAQSEKRFDTCSNYKQAVKIYFPIHRLIEDKNSDNYLLLTLKAGYEFRLNFLLCPYLQFGVLFPFGLGGNVGINFQGGNKFFFNKSRQVGGFYILPEYVLNNTRELLHLHAGNYKSLENGVALLFGYQQIFKKKDCSDGLTLDIFFGKGCSKFYTYGDVAASGYPRPVFYIKTYFGIGLGASI